VAFGEYFPLENLKNRGFENPACLRLRQRTHGAAAMHYSFLLLNGFTMHAFSSAAEVLRITHRVLGASDITYSALSMNGNPVAASNGFQIVANASHWNYVTIPVFQ